jgi:molecular chaperone GrpE
MDEKQVIDDQENGAAVNAAPSEEPFAPAVSPEEAVALREQAAKATEYRDQLLRMAADLENYKKRAAREKQEAIKFANEALLERLIPVLDNFEMALAAAGAANTSVESLRSGVQMIAQQLKSTMADAGLQEIDATGHPFDPNFHEALSQQESPDVPEGNVLQQIRKGYRLRERLIRPASVIVAKKAAS